MEPQWCLSVCSSLCFRSSKSHWSFSPISPVPHEFLLGRTSFIRYTWQVPDRTHFNRHNGFVLVKTHLCLQNHVVFTETFPHATVALRCYFCPFGVPVSFESLTILAWLISLTMCFHRQNCYCMDGHLAVLFKYNSVFDRHCAGMVFLAPKIVLCLKSFESGFLPILMQPLGPMCVLHYLINSPTSVGLNNSDWHC